ncbi:MAG: hemolysin family protein [Fidelibacterota bacterium]
MSVSVNIFLFVILLIFSGLFSGSETALFGARKENLRKLKSISSRRTLKLLSRPQKLLITILVGNTLVNIALATIASITTYELAQKYGFSHILTAFLEVAVVTLILLIFGEIIPKTIALHNAKRVSLAMSAFIGVCYTVFFPLTIILYYLGRLLEKSLKVREDRIIHSEEDIKTLVQIGEERGAFEEKEIEMITSLLESSDTCVREIMIPRPDMISVDAGRPIGEIFNFVCNQRFARFPVYKNDLDNIIGFIFEKDVLPYLDGEKKTDIESLLHPPLFIPENSSISYTITLFQEKKTKIAIVVDEYGGTSGMITLEDAIEKIVGDIQDENEVSSSSIKWLTRNECAVNASVNLDELENVLKISFPEERVYDTLGGFVMDRLGRIPAKHDAFRYKNHIFIVDEMENKRVQRIRITRVHRKAQPKK